jgi:hypothetical protein
MLFNKAVCTKTHTRRVTLKVFVASQQFGLHSKGLQFCFADWVIVISSNYVLSPSNTVRDFNIIPWSSGLIEFTSLINLTLWHEVCRRFHRPFVTILQHRTYLGQTANRPASDFWLRKIRFRFSGIYLGIFSKVCFSYDDILNSTTKIGRAECWLSLANWRETHV